MNKAQEVLDILENLDFDQAEEQIDALFDFMGKVSKDKRQKAMTDWLNSKSFLKADLDTLAAHYKERMKIVANKADYPQALSHLSVAT